jgi:hypothetical protein
VESIDRLLSFDSRPPLVTGGTDHTLNGRRQLARANCEPHLANLGTHPRVVEAMERLLGPVSLMFSPIPASTFRSAPGGERYEWGYHVDWLHTPPREQDLRVAFGVLHLSRVDPGGGAFMLIPRSHKLVEASLRDPALREQAFRQDFEHFPGLLDSGGRVEMRVRPAAGAIRRRSPRRSTRITSRAWTSARGGCAASNEAAGGFRLSAACPSATAA